MGDRSSIEWTDATWNPLRGCSRVSEGCRNCYAEKVAARFSGEPQMPYYGVATSKGWTGAVVMIDGHLDDPLRWRKPRRIFVNSMSDLFHERVSDEWIDQIFAVMALAPRHTFQVLTKRPERMRAYMAALSVERLEAAADRFSDDGGTYVANYLNGWSRPRSLPDDGNPLDGTVKRWPPPNMWLGVSVEDQAAADARVETLLETPAAVRFVSYEPALGAIDFTRLPPDGAARARGHHVYGYGPNAHIDALRGFNLNGHHTKIDWVIVGGESGPGARPFDVAWARSTIAQCRAAGVACFVKQLGARPRNGNHASGTGNDLGLAIGPGWVFEDTHEEAYHLHDRKGGAAHEWPQDLRVREFPVVREGSR